MTDFQLEKKLQIKFGHSRIIKSTLKQKCVTFIFKIIHKRWKMDENLIISEISHHTKCNTKYFYVIFFGDMPFNIVTIFGVRVAESQ